MAARINGALYAPWMSYGLPPGLFPEPTPVYRKVIQPAQITF